MSGGALGEKIAALDAALRDTRSREIFRQIVEAYLATGEPMGSRNISKILPMALSPASVRNVMSDLEALGLIYAPHTSAGRLPTETGLRFFVDAMLEVGDLPQPEQARIDAQLRSGSGPVTPQALLTEVSVTLSGLSRGAGVVLTTKDDPALKHIEFVPLDPLRALVVLVGENGSVENRIVSLPPGLPASALVSATNFLNARMQNRTLAQARAELETACLNERAEIDTLTASVIEAGLASWSEAADDRDRQLIVRGQGNLLEDMKALEDLERVRLLLDDFETKKDIVELLGRAETGDGVRIFIGSENKLFSLSGSSMIAAPFRDKDQKIMGVLGVIGPTRLNYARIVPVVDYTAKVVESLLRRS